MNPSPSPPLQCQTVREVFARQLMQISGLSGDKAAAILEHYNTPHRYVDISPSQQVLLPIISLFAQ